MNSTSPAISAALSGVGPLIRRLGQAHTQLWHERIGPEITGPQFTVLALLTQHGPLDQGTLGAYAHLDKSTAAPLIERLRQRGLVALEQDPADRRRKMISVTPEGRSLAGNVANDVTQVGEQLLDRLTPTERAKFVTLARKLLADEP
ncbi:MarR family transcriptional regulator [Mycolicibacterium porcinum]|nr:MarR family transcriptional regulator [Mycolicibacterium porcinum]